VQTVRGVSCALRDAFVSFYEMWALRVPAEGSLRGPVGLLGNVSGNETVGTPGSCASPEVPRITRDKMLAKCDFQEAAASPEAAVSVMPEFFFVFTILTSTCLPH
jgi:hypothetical protein